MLAAVAALLLSACSAYQLPGLWKTYEHPTYRFSVKIPRSWEVRPDASPGVAVLFIAPDEAGVFRANANVHVIRRQNDRTLDELARLSSLQLTAVMPGYRLLAQVPTSLGDIPAMELRGRQSAEDGRRILRTFLAFCGPFQYTLTFACSEESESRWQGVLEGIRRTFRAQAGLSDC